MSKIKYTVTPHNKIVKDDRMPARTILLKRELFAGLFSRYNDAGVAQSNDTPHVQHHRFLAHK